MRCRADGASSKSFDAEAPSRSPSKYYTLYSSGMKGAPSSSRETHPRVPSLSPPSLPRGRPLTIDEVRAEFPALTTAADPEEDHALFDGLHTNTRAGENDEDASPRRTEEDLPWAFMENAGGSQVPGSVAEAVYDHMVRSYAQLGAGYPHSNRATETVRRAHDVVSTLMGVEASNPSDDGNAAGKVILGASSTQLCATLAGCFDGVVGPDDELVVHRSGHEANIGPWVRLAERTGARLRWWGPGADGEAAPLDALRSALTPRTKILAVCHVSNLLGEIADLPSIVAAARRLAHPDCHVVVDGVAFAPHRAMAVADWGVDWYCCSLYKTYGPHVAAMYGSSRALAAVTTPNHYFIDPTDVPYAFELGGVSHEACAGVVATGDYLRRLAGGGRRDPKLKPNRSRSNEPEPEPEPLARSEVLAAFDVVTALEAAPTTALMRCLGRLEARGALRLIGPRSDDPTVRVPTVSFVPLDPAVSVHDVVAAAHAARVAIRNGNMYGVRLCEDLGVDAGAGVVRVSLVHYNTVGEVNRLAEAMEDVFGFGTD